MAYGGSLLECDWKKHPDLRDIVVSENGRVFSYRSGKWHELKPSISSSGYLRVGLKKENSRYIHRLVAETYIPNEDPNDKIQVNHLDGNKLNNCIGNLEWCTPRENDLHAYSTGLHQPKKGRMVRIIETGEYFKSLSDCARHIGGDKSHIYHCATGKNETHKGYHFEYVDEVITE